MSAPDDAPLEWDAFVTRALICVGLLEGTKRAALDTVEVGGRHGNRPACGLGALTAARDRLAETTRMLNWLHADVVKALADCGSA